MREIVFSRRFESERTRITTEDGMEDLVEEAMSNFLWVVERKPEEGHCSDLHDVYFLKWRLPEIKFGFKVYYAFSDTQVEFLSIQTSMVL